MQRNASRFHETGGERFSESPPIIRLRTLTPRMQIRPYKSLANFSLPAVNIAKLACWYRSGPPAH